MMFTHATVRENAARAPSRSTLAPPFREAWVGASRGDPIAQDDLLFVSDSKDSLAALDAVTGKRVWVSPWRASPALIHEGRLFARPVDRAELHVFDPATGHPQSAIFTPHSGEVVAIGDRLFGATRYSGTTLWALEWTSGRRLWTARHSENASLDSHFCACEDAIVYGLTDRGSGEAVESLVARRPEDGAELWRRSPATLKGIPAIRGDRVIADLNGRVTALGLADGEALWETEGGGGYLYGDHYYCVKGRFTGPWLYEVVDVASGRVLTRVDLQDRMPKSLRNARPMSVLFVSESHVFIEGGDSHTLLVFTRDGSEYVWEHRPKNAYVTGEIIGGEGRFYVRHRDRLFCIEAGGR